ncbi:MAG: class I SAM-dependent methyltransferase [Gammaproteobacteria bacterium]
MSASSKDLYDFLGTKYLELDLYRGDDMDVVHEAIAVTRATTILDAGCGPGQHVKECARLPYVERVVGVDFSPGMIKAAHRNLRGAAKGTHTILAVDDFLRPTKRFGQFDVALCMNNALGNALSENLPQAAGDRRRAVQNLSACLKPGGALVVSVYLHEYMPLDYMYGKHSAFSVAEESDIDAGDLVIQYTPSPSSSFHYYSHWFRRKELEHLLEASGIRIVRKVCRPPRLIAVCRAPIDTDNGG